MKITSELLLKKFDVIVGEPVCELLYKFDYELLIAVVLSAQSTDKGVNKVTEILFNKYDLYSLACADISDIENIIKPVGSYHKKAIYIKEIANRLVDNCSGIVPNNRDYLESLPGVGRKTCNVVLSHLFNVPAIAVDTHVERVSKRLNLVSLNDDVYVIEKKLNKFFPIDKWGRVHLQMVLFGRYYCKSVNPKCSHCLLKDYCVYEKKDN